MTFVGDLTDTDHDVAGKVYILDQDTLVVDEFSFDNNGFATPIKVSTSMQRRLSESTEKYQKVKKNVMKLSIMLNFQKRAF